VLSVVIRGSILARLPLLQFHGFLEFVIQSAKVTRFRRIPSIEQLRQREAMRLLEATYGRAAVVDALRAEAAALRERLEDADTPDAVVLTPDEVLVNPDDVLVSIERGVRARLDAAYAPSLIAVINATGVIIHTNLGRAPLASTATARVAALAKGYTNLEYDVAKGARGRRDTHAERLLCRLTGAEAAVVVNNNAAATLVSLAALAAGREVVISRGELVEIGGGFRVPDVMAQSGAVLREVGTTNRTRVSDYAAAISDRTALILRVHPSNFTIEGFAERPRLHDLVALGRRFNIPVVEDLGSGFLGFPTAVAALRDEPCVADSVAAGVTIVMFSGDKLLGGPQSGIIAGAADAVTRVRQHPLMRALRADKMTYAALEATLEEYAAGRAQQTVPVARMMAMSLVDLGRRADALATGLSAAGLQAEVIGGFSTIGGGSAPGSQLPTRLVALTMPAGRLEAALRAGCPPVIARIENERVLLDLRTVPPEEDDRLAALVTSAASSLFP
jgi:L-seryl-tRNA(Ser) seleniumtransferase